MNKERLINLRRVISEIPSPNLNMSFWTEIPWDESQCGTTHCAAGWFALDRWAQDNTPILELFECVPAKTPGYFNVRPRDSESMPDLEGFFGIDRKTCDRLFYPYEETFDGHEDIEDGSYFEEDFQVTPAMIVRNIDHLLKDEPLELYDAMTDPVSA